MDTGSVTHADLLQTLRAVFNNSAMRAIIPDSIFALADRLYIPVVSPYLRETLKVYDDFERMAMEAVSNARAHVIGQSNTQNASGALLRNLVRANLDVDDNERTQNDKNGLTDRELVSDMFVSDSYLCYCLSRSTAS
jgi:hypothetical protein